MGVGQPVDGGLEQPVLLDVLGVLVVGHLNGQREPVTTPDLVSEPDLAWPRTVLRASSSRR